MRFCRLVGGGDMVASVDFSVGNRYLCWIRAKYNGEYSPETRQNRPLKGSNGMQVGWFMAEAWIFRWDNFWRRRISAGLICGAIFQLV